MGIKMDEGGEEAEEEGVEGVVEDQGDPGQLLIGALESHPGELREGHLGVGPPVWLGHLAGVPILQAGVPEAPGGPPQEPRPGGSRFFSRHRSMACTTHIIIIINIII